MEGIQDFVAVSVETRQIMRALDQFDKKVRSKIERRGVRRAGKPVLASAKRLAPIADDYDVHDLEHEPGSLQKSLKLRTMKRKPYYRRMGIYGVVIQAGEDAHMFKGDHYYGGMVEFGTVYQAAQGFMLAARDENLTVTPRIWREEIRRYIEEIRTV